MRSGLNRAPLKEIVVVHKGGCKLAFTQDYECISRLHDIVDALLERDGLNALARYAPPFDVERLNDHDNKSAFLLEQTTVDQCITNANAIVDSLVAEKEHIERYNLTERLRKKIDQFGSKEADKLKINITFELVRRNIAEVGQSYFLLIGLMQSTQSLTERKQELAIQERDYWMITNRPANYCARTIVLRLARLYAREKGLRPTLGTARDGGHPSTSFGRALEQVFEVLEIKANIRSPGKWAIAQLTDADLEPQSDIRMGDLLGLPSGTEQPSSEIIKHGIAQAPQEVAKK